MEKTKCKYLGDSDQVKGLPQPSLADAYEDADEVYDLPAPTSLRPRNVDLSEAIVERVSVRQYSMNHFPSKTLLTCSG